MLEKKNPWVIENFHRDCTSKLLKNFKLNKNDVIMLSDIDEIPNLETINLLNRLIVKILIWIIFIPFL